MSSEALGVGGILGVFLVTCEGLKKELVPFGVRDSEIKTISNTRSETCVSKAIHRRCIQNFAALDSQF